MGSDVGVTAIDGFADQIERHDLPRHVRFRIDAHFRERHLEGHFRRRDDVIARNCLALETRNVLDPRRLRGQQALAPTVRTYEELVPVDTS